MSTCQAQSISWGLGPLMSLSPSLSLFLDNELIFNQDPLFLRTHPSQQGSVNSSPQKESVNTVGLGVLLRTPAVPRLSPADPGAGSGSKDPIQSMEVMTSVAGKKEQGSACTSSRLCPVEKARPVEGEASILSPTAGQAVVG